MRYKMRYDTVVIGGGLGGLSVALKLAQAGQKVAIVEKHFAAGGYATNFKRKGASGTVFNFDVALHGIGGLTEGASLNTYLKEMGVFSRIKPLRKSECATLLQPQGIFDIPDTFEAYKIFLYKKYPNEKLGIDKLFDFLKAFDGDMQDTISHQRPPRYFNELEALSLYEFLKRYTDDEDLIETFSFLWLYYGLPPKKLNALYYILAWTSYHIGGTFYIKGGGGQLSDAFVTSFKEVGGEIFLSNEVVDITTCDDQITQVVTQKGLVLEADHFVLSGDPLHLLSLIKEDNRTICKYKESLTHLEISTSLTQVYIGLDCKCSEIGITKSDYFIGEGSADKLWESIEKGDYASMGFGLTNYDALDSSFNKDKGVLCLVIGDHMTNWPPRGSEAYKEQKVDVANMLIERASLYFPKLKDHIEVIEVGSPYTMRRYTNNTSGAVYGWAQNLSQGGFNRLSQKSPLRNVYLASSWTMPGGGFEGAITSGVMCADRMLRDLSQAVSNACSQMDEAPIMSSKTLMAGMVANFNKEHAKDLSVIYEFIFDETDIYYVRIKNATAKLLTSRPEQVDVTIHAPYQVWYDISFNKLAGEDAVMDGKLKIVGDMNTFMKIPLLFSAGTLDPKQDAPSRKLFDGTLYISLTLIPWILYWSAHEYLSASLLMLIGTLWTLALMFFIKPKVFREVTKLEGITLFAFVLYGALDILHPANYTHIKPFMMDGLFILTWGLSIFSSASVTGEYSKYAYPDMMTGTKLFRKINRNLTLMWTLIFASQFLMTLTVPFPVHYLAYSLPVVGIIISKQYPKHILEG